MLVRTEDAARDRVARGEVIQHSARWERCDRRIAVEADGDAVVQVETYAPRRWPGGGVNTRSVDTGSIPGERRTARIAGGTRPEPSGVHEAAEGR